MTPVRLAVALVFVALVLGFLFGCASGPPDCTMTAMTSDELERALVVGCGR